jgi:NhaP-type Na+/H+ or K+/H+ antiporter
MPTLVATGLDEQEFKNLTRKKGVPVQTAVSEGKASSGGGGKSVQISEEDPTARTDYITEEEDNWFNAFRGWLDDVGPFPFALIFFTFATFIFMFGDYAMPGGVIFSMGLVWVLCKFCGSRAGELGLPPLVGMITCGFVLANVGALGDGDTWKAANKLGRGFALGIIMLRAGLGMDLAVILKNFGLLCLLGFIPALAEAFVVGAAAISLFGMDYTWGVLLGFTLADVSPAVTTPLLLDFQLQGYGVAKGIPTTLLAGGVLGSIFCIIMYGITFTLIFSGGAPFWLTIIIGVGQVFLGLAVGSLYGEMLHIMWDHHTATMVSRTMMTLLASSTMIFGGGFIGMGGGGTVAVICCGIYMANSLKEKTKPVEDMVGAVWSMVGQPLLFGLLGAAVSIKSLSPDLLGNGVSIVLIGLVARVISTYACVIPTDYTMKERGFTCITWCPKATVQAALSTVALDYVEDSANEKEFDDDTDDKASSYEVNKQRATVVLTVAVLSIIMTAPTFAIAIKYSGEAWLVKETNWKDGRPTSDDPEDEYEGDVELTINMGARKESLSSSLGDRKISFQKEQHGQARKWSIQKSEVTPSGVALRDRSKSNPATLAAMGLSSLAAREGLENTL